jgi:hypothetical protein
MVEASFPFPPAPISFFSLFIVQIKEFEATLNNSDAKKCIWVLNPWNYSSFGVSKPWGLAVGESRRWCGRSLCEFFQKGYTEEFRLDSCFGPMKRPL